MAASFLMGLRERVRPRRALRRLWRNRDPRRAGLRPILINGFPKSGTHLLQRCVSLLPGMAWEWLWVSMDLTRRLACLTLDPANVTTETRPPALAEFDRLISSLSRGEYLMAHLHFEPPLARLLEIRGLRSLLIMRDPRDVAVSYCYHLLTHPDNPWHRYFTYELQSWDERLMTAVRGAQASPEEHLPDMGKRMNRVLPWMEVPLNYTVRFERLVGPEGGGDAQVQRDEIQNIARHVGISLSPAQVDSIAAQLFGRGSGTFRRGQVGSWKEHFREEHKDAFKRVAGELLIQLGYEKSLDW